MNKHWTSETAESYLFSIASDYVDALAEHLESHSISRRELATRMKVTEGRVSQIFNSPGNLTLETMIACAQAAGLKLGVLAYDDGDSNASRGPIHSSVFLECWKKCGAPTNWHELVAEKEDGNETEKTWALDVSNAQSSIFEIHLADESSATQDPDASKRSGGEQYAPMAA